MEHSPRTDDQAAGPPRQSVWNTHDAKTTEQFAYYREAVCKAFMNLTPEQPPVTQFSAKVESIGLGNGALNRVLFPEHTVRRLKTDIAASDRRCYYLNLKLAGRCRIEQAGREIVLSPGQVGIFDSGQLFSLYHGGGPSLAVASFWVPYEDLHARLPGSFDVSVARISDDPFVGHLVAEVARTLNATVQTACEHDSIRLFNVMLDLVALSLSKRARTPVGEAAGLAEATMLAVRRAIHDRLRRPDLSVAAIAAAVGISERYVHKLFERIGTTFSGYVMDRRLDGAASDLRNPAMAGQTVGSIAFDWGFADLSHFTRRFRQRFQCTPREWRHRRPAPDRN